MDIKIGDRVLYSHGRRGYTGIVVKLSRVVYMNEIIDVAQVRDFPVFIAVSSLRLFNDPSLPDISMASSFGREGVDKDLFFSSCIFEFKKNGDNLKIEFERQDLDHWAYNIYDTLDKGNDTPSFMADCHEKIQYPDIVLAQGLLMDYLLSL